MIIINKYYIDEIYDLLLIRPFKFVSQLLWQIGDVMIIDGLGPDGMAKLSNRISGVMSRVQSGYVYHYILLMVVGLVGILTWYVIR